LIKNTSQTGILRQVKRIHFEKRLIKMDSYPADLSLIFIKRFDYFSNPYSTNDKFKYNIWQPSFQNGIWQPILLFYYGIESK